MSNINYNKYIGQKWSNLIESEIIMLHNGTTVPDFQVITRNSIVTSDYRLDRYRIVVNNTIDNIIERIYNG